MTDWSRAVAATEQLPRTNAWVAPVGVTIDDAIVAFLLDALGGSDPVSRTPKPTLLTDADGQYDSPPVSRQGTWQATTASCTIAVHREAGFFPADVNQPAQFWDHVLVLGWRHDRPTIVRVSASVGSNQMSIAVAAPTAEHDDIVLKFLVAFDR